MAIYHMQAKVVSRGSGRSAVAASAYMSCSRMYNDYDGIQHDSGRKSTFTGKTPPGRSRSKKSQKRT